MKKFAIVLMIATLTGCENHSRKITRQFIIDNQSDWRVVVSITNIKELGKKVDKSLYTVFKRNDVYTNAATSNRIVLNVYENSQCELVSVNGAKIKTKTDNLLVLENSEPMDVLVVNETGQDILLNDEPVIRGNQPDYFYCGDLVVSNEVILPRFYYVPLFKPQKVSAKNTHKNPVPIRFSAWQIAQLHAFDNPSDEVISKKINRFASETIQITNNWTPIKTQWKKEGNNLFLILKND